MAVAIANISIAVTGLAFPAAIMNLLAPAINTMDTLPALLIVIFLTQFLWFSAFTDRPSPLRCGLHLQSLTRQKIWLITHRVLRLPTSSPMDSTIIFLQVAGSGLTLGLVLFMMKSKAKSFKSIGVASLVPSIFGINEPVIFGLPILLNPYMFIPFVFGPLLITVLTYFSMKVGLVGYPVAAPPGFLPPGVGAFLTTYDWRSVVLVFVSLILMALIYYPFFKMMEKDELKREAQSEGDKQNMVFTKRQTEIIEYIMNNVSGITGDKLAKYFRGVVANHQE